MPLKNKGSFPSRSGGHKKRCEPGRNPPCISRPSSSSGNSTNVPSSLLRQNADLFPPCSAYERTIRATRLSLYQLHTEVLHFWDLLITFFFLYLRLSPGRGWSWADCRQNYTQCYLPGSFLTGCIKQTKIPSLFLDLFAILPACLTRSTFHYFPSW